jgi:Ser/Thr protein kinase RdoA (MazF antagonist)
VLQDLRALLLQHWEIDADEVDVLEGGMNSRTWRVAARGERWVLKIVAPQSSRGFRSGLHAAAVLDAAGVPAGAPVLGRDHRTSVDMARGTAALLAWVEGEPLSTSPGTVGQIGRVLAHAHSILREVAIPDAPPFDWIDTDAPHLAVEPWVRSAVSTAVGDWDAIRDDVPSWCFLHGDPAPEVFRYDRATSTCGIIDWASGVHGPLLYDLASAAMYVGDDHAPTLVNAYADQGEVSRSEIEIGLPVLQRYRYAVQADYFARRVYDGDLTGVIGPEENQKGLDDARSMLGA